jgi:tetratricopeptide (TPR) repeat protein
VRTPLIRAFAAPPVLLLVAVLLLVPGPFGADFAAARDPAGTAGDPAGTADDVTARARGLIDGGSPARAVPLLEDAAVAAPADAQVVFLLGVAYHRTGRPREAVIALSRAAALAPPDGEMAGLIRYNLGAARFAVGDYDAAAEAFLAVPSRAPQAAAAAYLNAGLARYKAGRVPEARALLAQAVEAEPDGPSADTARRMLDALSPPSAAPAPAARRGRPSWGFAAGREFDTNVFALPDDATTTHRSDGRYAVKGEAEYRVPVSGRYDLTPHYDFYGYWYDTEHAYNYRRHRVFLRLNDRRGALRPRLTWGYDFARLGGDAYLSSHWLDGRLTVRRGPGARVWVRAGVAVEEAPGQQYDYLSGASGEAVLSGYHAALADGWVYGALRLRYRDRGTAAVTFQAVPVRVDYSYASVEPQVRARTTLPGRLEVTGDLGYEVRRYLHDDRWTGPTPGSKRRLDQRVYGGIALARALGGGLKATLSWSGEVRRSNIGNAATDYRNRDYERQLFGAFLAGDW